MERGTQRWRILALLFAVRGAMAFQFQAVGALSPLFIQQHGFDLGDIGLLIGIYLAPGIVIALPGGALAARFGDLRMVLAGLVLMVVGGMLAIVGDSLAAQIAARVLAGTGGVMLNVLMTKMVSDLFAGREIATAMAIFVNSWPFGIALALLVLPVVAEAGGLAAALAVPVAGAAGAFVLLATLYRAPPAPGGVPPVAAWPRGAAAGALLLAGSLWALINGAISMVFSFGPALLAERGLSLSGASATTSLVLWLIVVSVPLGGILADRTGRRDLVILLGIASFVAGLVAARGGATPLLCFLLIGIGGGLPAGPIISLTAVALRPETRAAGMGLFYTLYYVSALAAPFIAGRLSEWSGSAAASFDFGAAMLVACVPLLWLFRRITPRLRGG